MRSPRLGAPGLRPADLLAAALGGRPRPRLAVGAFASAVADVVLLAGGVLLTRVSTRSAVSRSVSRVATAASCRSARNLVWPGQARSDGLASETVGLLAMPGYRQT